MIRNNISEPGLLAFCTGLTEAYCWLLVSHLRAVPASGTMRISSEELLSASPWSCAHLQKGDMPASVLFTVTGLRPRSSKR